MWLGGATATAISTGSRMTFFCFSSGAGGLKLLFLAGDGLTLMRMNHLLASEPDVWLDQTPVIVPIQGEHPHGFGHGLHAQYRMYKRFLMKLAAEIDNPQILEDWGISDLNVRRMRFRRVRQVRRRGAR